MYYGNVETGETTESGTHQVISYNYTLEDGKHFRYWELYKLGSNYVHFVAVLEDNNTKYTINYQDADGNKLTVTGNPTGFTYDAPTTIDKIPAKEGYTFNGWTVSGIKDSFISASDDNKKIEIKKGS